MPGPCPTYRLCCQAPKRSATHSLKRRVVVARKLPDGTKSISVNAKGRPHAAGAMGLLQVKPEGGEAARRRTRGRELRCDGRPKGELAISASRKRKAAMAAMDEGIERSTQSKTRKLCRERSRAARRGCDRPGRLRLQAPYGKLYC